MTGTSTHLEARSKPWTDVRSRHAVHCPDRIRPARAAFSLVEVMLAIVILGIGLVMVATMFPVAWSHARRLHEETTEPTVAGLAEEIVKSIVRVDGKETHGGGFAGDLIFYEQFNLADPSDPGDVMSRFDTRVHALNMENLYVSPRRIAWENPWLRERTNYIQAIVPCNPASVLELENCFIEARPPDMGMGMFIAAQVNLESRVYPPMRTRRSQVFTEPDDEWDRALDNKRYAWAVLHRLRAVSGLLLNPANRGERLVMDPWGLSYPDDSKPVEIGGVEYPPPPRAAMDVVNNRRDFDLYIVTLRRPQSANRYAQQNPASAPDPTDRPYPPAKPRVSIPLALEPKFDLLFPVPWRVQVYFPVPDDPNALPTGIPTEVEVNTENVPSLPFVADMFPVGAQFIDEFTGKVYRVMKRRLTGAAQEGAILTLDQEVLWSDLLVDSVEFPGDNTPLSPRPVWIFPPPCEAGRPAPGQLTFVGGSPVVGVDIRTLSVSPRG